MKIEIDPKLDLVLEKIVPASPEQIYKAWTDQVGIKNWFCPKPWQTVECEMELRPGGKFFTVMQSPEGQKFPSTGCFLELVPYEKLVWTSALQPGFRPSPKPPCFWKNTLKARSTQPSPCTKTKRAARFTSRWAFTTAGAWLFSNWRSILKVKTASERKLS